MEKRAPSCNCNFILNIEYTYIFFLFLLLSFCFRISIGDLEIVSQTDLKCVWSTKKCVTQEKYAAVPLNDMPCFKNKISPCELEVDNDRLFDFFTTNLPKSAISKHK